MQTTTYKLASGQNDFNKQSPSKKASTLSLSAVCVAAVVGLWSNPVAADGHEGLNGFIFAGPALAPDFEGGDDYEAVPGIVGYLEYEGRSAILTGTDLDTDLLTSPRFNLGPSFTYRFERDDVENDQVDLLDDVDAAFEVGGNFAINFQELVKEGDGLSVGMRLLQDVSDGHEGFVARASVNYSYPVTQRLNIMAGLEITGVSDDYAESYFGVSAAESARSGLSAYDADGGLKDAKITFLVNYAVSENWGIGGYVSYGQLMGDFADSSLVEEAGSEHQLFGMLGVQYRF